MSRWPGKYVIGLTGNIGSGKSVVRRMLEHLGAYGIDADSLAHRVLRKGAPGYTPAIETFGQWILDDTGQIDRPRLGKIVFSSPGALARLEAIVHPHVRQAIDVLIRHARQPVAVIEAIKLIEGGLAEDCDAVWVVDAEQATRLARLVSRRGYSPNEARQRIESQPGPQSKLAAADVVIRNNGSFENTWSQVLGAWKVQFPEEEAEPVAAEPGQLVVQRASPSQADQIARLFTRLSGGERQMTRADVMAAFGEKGFLLLLNGPIPVGLLGWQVENLVTRVTDFLLDSSVPLEEAAARLIEQMETASSELQSEASLLFLPDDFARQEQIWVNLGYEKRSVSSITVRAWQEAAQEAVRASGHSDEALYFKRLRADRVLRPI